MVNSQLVQKESKLKIRFQKIVTDFNLFMICFMINNLKRTINLF